MNHSKHFTVKQCTFVFAVFHALVFWKILPLGYFCKHMTSDYYTDFSLMLVVLYMMKRMADNN